MSKIIQSLWIGPELSNLERLSIKSFIDNGHTYHLYVYNKVKNVPKRAIIMDANKIINKREIFTYRNGSYAAFANLFRFIMLYKKGGYWVDTDIICIKPFDIKTDIVIATEPNKEYNENVITSFFIKLPKHSNIALQGIKIQNSFKNKILDGTILWAAGHKTVKILVKKYNLDKYIKKWDTFCSCSFKHMRSMLSPNYKPNNNIITKLQDAPNNMICIHFWNEVWRRNRINKNDIFEPESLYEILKKKHNIK